MIRNEKFSEEIRTVDTITLRILTSSWHVPYLYLLARTGYEFHTVGGWNIKQRPQPSNISVISYAEALSNLRQRNYDLVIGHHPLHDLRVFGFRALIRGIPYVQVLHGRMERTGYKRSLIKKLVKRAYKNIVLRSLSLSKRVTFVFISPSVESSWGLRGAVITPGIPIEEMGEWNGVLKTLLVVGNNLHREHFDYTTLLKLADQVPVKIVGENPQIPGAAPASSWDELKSYYSQCRAYVNLTREPEDGYNLATLEAMASGMPVLTLAHPTSPVQDGYNGLVAQNFTELVAKAHLLLENWDLARRLGEKAKETIAKRFGMEVFVNRWRVLIESCVEGQKPLGIRNV